MIMLANWAKYMEFNEDSVIKLLTEKKLEVAEGVFLHCSDEINMKVYEKDGNVIIEFSAPFAYVHVESFGPKRLLNLVKPRVEYVKLTPKSRVIKLSSLPEIEVEK